MGAWAARWIQRHLRWQLAWAFVLLWAVKFGVDQLTVLAVFALTTPALACTTWCRLSPSSYERFLSGPYRRLRWRRHARRRWERITEACGLTRRVPKVVRRDRKREVEHKLVHPKLRRVRTHGHTLELTIRTRAGQTVDDLDNAVPRIAATLGAVSYRTRPVAGHDAGCTTSPSWSWPARPSARRVPRRRGSCGCSSAVKAGIWSTTHCRPTSNPNPMTLPERRWKKSRRSGASGQPSGSRDSPHSRRSRSRTSRSGAPSPIPRPVRRSGLPCSSRSPCRPTGGSSPERAHRAGRASMTTDERRSMRCPSRGWSTGGGRTSAGQRATRSSNFAAVEPQKRLAPHLHAAIRGAIPRQVIREVTAGTYSALCWPSIDRVVYDEADELPQWDSVMGGSFDPNTGEMLTAWDDAIARIDGDPNAKPFHVLSFGSQVDIKGFIGGTDETSRAVGYLCKYLTKAVAEPGLVPGQCDSKAHSRECVGLGGRRVLVSRHWTGKTLSDHKADRAEVVRAALEVAGIEPPDARRMAADMVDYDGRPVWVWEDVPPIERNYGRAIAHSIRQRREWINEYERAKELIAARPP